MNIVPWLVRHASWSRTRYNVGADGMTAYQRLNGAAYAGVVALMGEVVMVKVATDKT